MGLLDGICLECGFIVGLEAMVCSECQKPLTESWYNLFLDKILQDAEAAKEVNKNDKRGCVRCHKN